jgi:hypothetical protein
MEPPVLGSLRQDFSPFMNHDRPPSGCAQLLEEHPLVEASDAKSRADRLLRSLLEESALLESRLADSGRLDPIRAVSGRSAMDRAIESTRSILGAMDRLLRRSDRC